MLKVCYSNKPEALAVRLQEDLVVAVGMPPRDLFKPTQLIVASRPLETWLLHQLAPRVGIVANFETWMLRRFTSALVVRAFPGKAALDGRALSELLLAIFLDGELAGHELAPVRSYLGRTGRGADELRAAQLAAQLGRVFEEYIFSRAEMLEAWAQRRPSPADGGGELAAWQSKLWRRVLAASQDRFVLPTRLTEIAPSLLVPGGEPLFAFGLSILGQSYHQLLVHLAKACDVHVYALNPCMEFWEDLPSVRDRKQQFARKAESLSPAALAAWDPYGLRNDECRPLALWGRPGREAVRLLNEASRGTCSAIYVDPKKRGDSLLRGLQADMLVRKPGVPDETYAQGPASDGIELVRAPSVRRECEFVAGRIWALLQSGSATGDNAALRLDEIAVLIAAKDAEEYVAPLLNTFREHSDLPWQLTGLPFALTSPVVEAALLLLELPLSRLTRADLLRVMTHPIVAERFPGADARSWVDWSADLGIAHGASHADHQGTYIERDVLNWDQGLKRIALGAFLSTRAENDERLFPLGDERYLPDPAGRKLEEGAGALLLLARSLLADAQALRSAERTAREWSELLATLLSAYLTPRDDAEKRALDACLKSVRELATHELGSRPISFRLAKELTREQLASAGASSGGAVSGGVRISTLSASRAIPARVTFIVGLSEGAFPASDRPDALDLRAKRPQAGDASGREKDEYLFLEALLCANDRLILSHVSRDERTGAQRNASPVVVELQHLLDAGYLGRDGSETDAHPLVTTLPLWRADADPAGDAKIIPTAPGLAERRLRSVGATLRMLAGPLAPGTTARELTAQLGDHARVELSAALRFPPSAPPSVVEEETRRITLSQLRGYLSCPLQGSARVRLRLEDDEEDLLDRSDEVFTASAMTAARMAREVFIEAFREGGAPALSGDSRIREETWERHADLLVEQGELPIGPFLEAQRTDDRAVLDSWCEAAKSLGVSENLPLQLIRFGPADEHDRVEQVLDAPNFLLELPGPVARTIRVQLVGATEPQVGPDACLRLLRKKAPPSEDDQLIDAIGCWLDRVVLAASGLLAPAPYEIALAYRDRVCPIRLRPIAQDEARALLATLLTDLLAGDNELLLPLAAVVEKSSGSTRPFPAIASEMLSNQRRPVCRGPLRRLDGFRIPDEDEAARLIGRRFTLFFDRLVRAEPAAAAADASGADAKPTKAKPGRKSKKGGA